MFDGIWNSNQDPGLEDTAPGRGGPELSPATHIYLIGMGRVLLEVPEGETEKKRN